MNAPAPGSAEWLKFMTASKISAVMGTSPYESKFSLWHRMAGMIGAQEQNDQMTVGNILEPALLEWFASQHPEFVVVPGQWETHATVTWAGATPDGYACSPANCLDIEALVEVKTARDAWEWRDSIPAGYYDQVQWQMWVTGTEVTYVAALVAMELVERVVKRDSSRIGVLRAAAEQFMATIEADVPPPIDGSTFTYLAIRELHDEIDGSDAEVPGDLATRWLEAKALAADWSEAEQQAKSEIANLMGEAKRARWDGTTLFNRQARNGGTPYLVAGRNLPTIERTAA